MVYKLTNFIISMVLIGMFVGGIGIFLNQGAVNYNISSYDNESINRYERLDNFTYQTEELRNKSVSIKTESGLLDVIGGYFKSAYTALVITQSSYEVSIDMAQEGTSSAKLGSFKHLLIQGLVAILAIIFFVGILLKAIFKVEL